MPLPTIDFAFFTVEDIRECLENTGYLTDDREFEVANDGNFKYLGYSNCQYRYLMGFEDESSPLGTDGFLVSRVYVSLGREGKLIAEYGGCPEYQGDYDGMVEYLEKTCN